MMVTTWWWELTFDRTTRAARRGRRVLALEPLENRTTPTAIIAVGAPAGSAAVVTVFDAVTRQQKFTLNAYDNFTGGVNVAVGDVNGDGTADVITGAAAGGGPTVRVFSGVDGSAIGSVDAGDPLSRAGSDVAAGDFDQDGKADLVVGTILNGRPTAQVLRFSDRQVLHAFTPFGVGVASPSVAVGDFNGDGRSDVVTGAAAGGGPQVVVFDGSNEAVLLNRFAFEDGFRGGVQVSAGDLSGDGRAEVVAAAGNLGGPRVVVFAGGSGDLYQNFFAYDAAARRGVGGVAADADGNGSLDLLTVDGAGTAAALKAFDGRTLAALSTPLFPGLLASGAYDTRASTATLAGTSPAVAKAGPFAVTATFSEPVNGFSAAGLAVTSGTVTNFVAVDARTYTFDLTPTARDTPATVQVSAGSAADVAGNPTAASNTLTRTVDTAGPTVTADALTTNDPTPTLTGTVSEAGSTVTVTVSGPNGSGGPITAIVVGTAWSATIPDALPDGTYDITATATDPAGNPGTVTRTGGLVRDSVRPVATVSTTVPETSPTRSSPIPFTVTFSQDVTGFNASDIAATNGTVTNFQSTDARTYTFGVIPGGQGSVAVSVPENRATDAAGNGNTASNSVSRTFDSIAPAVTANTLTTNDTTPTLTGTVDDPTATVSVRVTGNGQDQTAQAVITGSNWNATFNTPLPQGTYDFSVTSTDPAGNVGVATRTGGLVIDGTAPTASVAGPTGPSKVNPLTFTVTFSEAVSDFDDTPDVDVRGGTVASISPVGTGGTQYAVTVNPTADGTVTLSVNADVALDVAGNGNVLSETTSAVYDTTPPNSTVLTTANGSFSGTATDAVSGIATVEIAITDPLANGLYWDGDGFDSSTPVYLGATVTGTGPTRDWNYLGFAGPSGSYTVTGRVTDTAANVALQTQLGVNYTSPSSL